MDKYSGNNKNSGNNRTRGKELELWAIKVDWLIYFFLFFYLFVFIFFGGARLIDVVAARNEHPVILTQKQPINEVTLIF